MAHPARPRGTRTTIRTRFRRRTDESPVVAGRRGPLRVAPLEDRAVPAMVTTAGLRFAVGGVDAGGASNVRVYDADGGQLGDVDVSDLSGTTRPTLATADVTGDGVEGVVVGLGDGVVNRVRVVDGRRSRPPSTAVRSTPSPVG